MEIGTVFTIHGFTATTDGKSLVGVREQRIKRQHGSAGLTSEQTTDTWPNNAKGTRAAMDWTIRQNRATAERFRTHETMMAKAN